MTPRPWARGLCAALVALVVLVAGASVAEGTAACRQRTPQRSCITIKTVPPVAGVTIVYNGRHFVTNERGRTRILARTVPIRGGADRGLLRPSLLHVLPKQVRPGVVATFERHYKRGTTIALRQTSRVRLRFADLQGRPVDARRVRSFQLKSRTGVRYTVKGGDAVTLPASRVVSLQRSLQSKPIEYALESADIDGSNVVNRAQLRFRPLKQQDVKATLLLYAARFSSRDALFGFSLGSHIVLTSASGRVYRPELRDGGASLEGLARGRYTVSVEAPGLTVKQPLELSRDQVVELEVLSYFDIVLAGLLLTGIAFALLAARRPHLRRPWKALREHSQRAAVNLRGDRR